MVKKAKVFVRGNVNRSVNTPLTDRQKRLLFPFFLFVPFLMGINVDLYVPSLPAITHYFRATASSVQLTVAFYMLGYAIGQFFLCTLSDSWGRRKLLIGSALFYTQRR